MKTTKGNKIVRFNGSAKTIKASTINCLYGSGVILVFFRSPGAGEAAEVAAVEVEDEEVGSAGRSESPRRGLVVSTSSS